MSKVFRVSTSSSGRQRRVRVVIYDTAEEMRAAARKYRDATDGFINAIGLSQPRSQYSVAADGAVIEHSGAGVVRLVKGEMGADVLSHEMTHMALAIYRDDIDAEESLSDMKNEETLCHIVSDLVKSANRQFWKAGIYE